MFELGSPQVEGFLLSPLLGEFCAQGHHDEVRHLPLPHGDRELTPSSQASGKRMSETGDVWKTGEYDEEQQLIIGISEGGSRGTITSSVSERGDIPRNRKSNLNWELWRSRLASARVELASLNDTTLVISAPSRTVAGRQGVFGEE